MIDKINSHYSMTNPASIYDEESLTALELAGRTASKVNEVVNAYNILENKILNAIKQNVDEWLKNNPDASATVNSYCTPQMFGAKADGITDDTEAIQRALNSHLNVYFPEGTYYTTQKLNAPANRHIYGCGLNSVIRSVADVVLETSKATIIDNLKFIGNGSNTAISLHQAENVISDVLIQEFHTGVKNRNVDYMGSDVLKRVVFDTVINCVHCATLCNGVTFDGCSAYRFSNFIVAYFMESVTLKDCFMEKGYDGSSIFKQDEEKSLFSIMGVSLHGCYIEGVTTLLSSTNAIGSLNIVGCWLQPIPTLYEAPTTQQAKLNFTFISNSFCLKSTASISDPYFIVNKNQKVFLLANTGTKVNSGYFEPDTNQFVGDNVYFIDQLINQLTNDIKNKVGGDTIIHKKTMRLTTNENGVVNNFGVMYPSLILGCEVLHGSYTQNLCVNYFSSGDNYLFVVRSAIDNEPIVNTEVVLTVFYIENTNVINDNE